jgi:GH25 family lysozyme M1 (1,4-beta-N-acetylmuramidase)
MSSLIHKSHIFADISSNDGNFNAHEYNKGLHKPPFIVIKATQGTDYRNPYHDAWAKDAHAQHIAVGHYHYADAYGNPVEEARYFWGRVWAFVPQGSRDFLILDLEKPQMNPQIYMVEFEAELRHISNRNCIKYTGEAYYHENDLHSAYPKWWIANYSRRPTIEQELWAWQFTETGTHSGIPGHCDLSTLVAQSAIDYWCK